MPKLPFNIGADPEFTFVSNNIRYAAIDIIANGIKNKKQFNADGKHLGYYIDEAGTLGWDGHESSGEIRPRHSTDPKEVTENIGKLLLEAHKCQPTAEMKTTSIWMSVGGHVHLEAKEFGSKSAKTQKIIQRALASLSLPLLANENPINVEIRRERGLAYGDILDARVNGVTYETRFLTAEWITTPEICNATLSYLGVIWNEIYNHPERIEQLAEIIAKTDQQIRALQEIVIDEYGALTHGLISQIKKHVRKFELYEEFKTECELIFDIKRVREAKEKVDFDIVRGWKFREKHKGSRMPNFKEITDEKLTKEKLKEYNLDQIKDYIQVFWEGERNMEAIARRIGDTIIAWEWQVTNRYFLIPLSKGIPSPIAMNGKGEFLTGTEMIKTKADYHKLMEIMEWAKDKFAHRDEFKRTTICLKSGKSETDESRSIIIGIPYKLREEGVGIEEILSIIHKNEAKKIKPIILENPKDIDLPTEHPEFKEGFLITMMKTSTAKEAPKQPAQHAAQNINEAIRTQRDREIPEMQVFNQEAFSAAELEALMEEMINDEEDPFHVRQLIQEIEQEEETTQF